MSSAPVAPVKLRDAAIAVLREKGLDPSPKNLVEDSRRKDAPLHAFFYEVPDELWVTYGRYEAARRIIQSVKVDFEIGGKTIESRAYEYVRPNGHGRWAAVEDIVADPELRDAYMSEIERLMVQASAKMTRLRALMKG